MPRERGEEVNPPEQPTRSRVSLDEAGNTAQWKPGRPKTAVVGVKSQTELELRLPGFETRIEN